MNNFTNEAALPNLLKRGQFLLEDYDYKTARQLFDQALNVDPESGAAYIGLAKATARITRNDEFFEYCVEQHHRDNAILQRARQFADDEWKAFFDRVDKEVQKRGIEKAIGAKRAKKTIGLIVSVIALIVAVILVLPNILFFPADKLYKSGQYKQAYERAVQIASSGLGEVFAGDKVEKYAYAYLANYIKEYGVLEKDISKKTTLQIQAKSTSSYCEIKFVLSEETDSNKYQTEAFFYKDKDVVNCSFDRWPVTSNSIYDRNYAKGEFIKANYINENSIDWKVIGLPWYYDSSVFKTEMQDFGGELISRAFSLIQSKLGIPAEHLGFYSYR